MNNSDANEFDKICSIEIIVVHGCFFQAIFSTIVIVWENKPNSIIAIKPNLPPFILIRESIFRLS
ncbi:MAG: hypothetical protein ACBR12_14710 [Microcoleus sp.]